MRFVYSVFSILILLSALNVSVVLASVPIVCEGSYDGHLQGITTDGTENIFWSFTKTLVKTDLQGKISVKVRVDTHHGDLCFHQGKVYVAVNLGEFNKEPGKADSWVYVYDAENLQLLNRFAVPQVVHGAGGMDYRDGFFYVIGGLPEGYSENYVYKYDPHFNFIQRRVISSGYTLMGIQTACFSKGCWWFGCYGNPRECIQADPEFKFIKRFKYDCSLGITKFREGFFVAEGFEKYRGRISFIESPLGGR